MTERDRLVLKLMHLAYLVHTLTDYCVFINFSGHVEHLDISVRKSKENWQTQLFFSEIVLAYHKYCVEDGPTTAELRAKIEILERIIQEGEIPFEDMDYEEEYVRHYRL